MHRGDSSRNVILSRTWLWQRQRSGGNGNGPFAQGRRLAERSPAAPEPRGRAVGARRASCWTTTSSTRSPSSSPSEDFYRDAHQIIYRAIRDLYDLGKAVDAVTLADELTRRDQYKRSAATRCCWRSSTASPTRPTPSTTPRSSARSRSAASSSRARPRSSATATRTLFTAQQLLEIGRAEDLHDRRGPDPGRHARDQAGPREGDGPDRRSGPRRSIPSRAWPRASTTSTTSPAASSSDQLIILAARPEHGQDGAHAEHLRPCRDHAQGPRPVREPGDGQPRDRRAAALRPVAGRRPQAADRPGPGLPRAEQAGQGVRRDGRGARSSSTTPPRGTCSRSRPWPGGSSCGRTSA